MNRRNFLKSCGLIPFVVGIFTSSVGGNYRSGTRYCGEASTGIDPNSEWAKQKPLTVKQLQDLVEEMDNLVLVGDSNDFLYYTIYLDEGIHNISDTIRIPENIRIEGINDST